MVQAVSVPVCPECGSGKLYKAVYIRYRDHVLFRNCLSEKVEPMEREAIGWVLRQNEEAIWLVSDKQLGKDISESGLVILRPDILELKTL